MSRDRSEAGHRAVLSSATEAGAGHQLLFPRGLSRHLLPCWLHPTGPQPCFCLKRSADSITPPLYTIHPQQTITARTCTALGAPRSCSLHLVSTHNPREKNLTCVTYSLPLRYQHVAGPACWRGLKNANKSNGSNAIGWRIAIQTASARPVCKKKKTLEKFRLVTMSRV